MLDELERLTESLNALYLEEGKGPVAFAFGRMDELNSAIADQFTDGFLLFHEGYFLATPRVLPNNSVQESHSLTLWFFTGAEFSGQPIDKRHNLSILKPLYLKAYRLLDRMGTISSPSATMNAGLNKTDRNIDGIRLTLVLTLNEAYPC